MTLLQSYLTLMGSLWWINIVLSVFVIFFGRKNPRSTLMWVMVLMFVPIFGFLFYLFLGQDFRKSRMFQLKESEDRMAKSIAGFQTDTIREGKFWYNDERSLLYEDLIRMNLSLDESFYTQDNQIEPFFGGQEKFESLLKDIESARKSIDIQYYIFKMDGIGKRIVRALERKAKQGVRVRLLYDAVGGRTIRRSDMHGLLSSGGKVAVFFPSLIPMINLRLNYRNHRKVVVIDDEIGYVGGFNVGDEYLGRDRRMGPWRDTHLRIKGTAVLGLKLRFVKDWYYASKDDKDSEKPIRMQLNEEGSSGVQIVTSGPDTQLQNIKNGIFKMINSAKSDIYIQTPYFVPDEAVMEALKTAIISGVNVHLMIPCKPDHPFVYWATYAYMGELVELGAKAYTYNNGFLHSKVVLIDDFLSTVGSTNMDIRSFALNFECNAFVYDAALNEKLRIQFEEDLEFCEEITVEKYRARSRIIKVKEAISRLLSPIL